MAAVPGTKDEEDLVYDEEEEAAADEGATSGAGGDDGKSSKKGHQVGVHSSDFRDFLLKPDLLKAIVECGFENPSEVQHEAIPQAIMGMDILCYAKSGMGKTAVFVLTTLNQLVPKDGETSVIVLAHTRELAFQIGYEYQRFSKFMKEPAISTMVLFGGIDYRVHKRELESKKPHIVVGTPGRVFHMIEEGALKTDKVKFFVVDECDKMLATTDMRQQVQKIFLKTPPEKQVMMFSATLSKEVRPVCHKFLYDPYEIYVDADSKLTLHGLYQYYVKLDDAKKNRKLIELLDELDFNQVVIFVSTASRSKELDRLLKESNFPSIHINGQMPQKQRIELYTQFKRSAARILVATNLFGRGIDIENVNIVVNYDFPMPDDKSGEPPADQYLHRVGRAGRFGTKGLAISFVASETDETSLAAVQERFAVKVPSLPDKIDPKTYM